MLDNLIVFCLPLISKTPGQLSQHDWNEITFSFFQSVTAPPDIAKGTPLYFTELTTLSTVNVQITQAQIFEPKNTVVRCA